MTYLKRNPSTYNRLLLIGLCHDNITYFIVTMGHTITSSWWVWLSDSLYVGRSAPTYSFRLTSQPKVRHRESATQRCNPMTY